MLGDNFDLSHVDLAFTKLSPELHLCFAGLLIDLAGLLVQKVESQKIMLLDVPDFLLKFFKKLVGLELRLDICSLGPALRQFDCG